MIRLMILILLYLHLVCIDLQKVFDTVYPHLLVDKLEKCEKKIHFRSLVIPSLYL